MNKTAYIIGGVVIAVAAIVIFALHPGGSATQTVATNAPNTPSSYTQPSATSGASTTSQTAGANPEDVVPGLYPNPIKNTSTKSGIKLTSVMVENNVDAAGNAVSDHLQFVINNLTNQTLSNLEAYYTITDSANGKKEGYYKPLTGITIPAHGSVTVHFDNQSGYGHFPANMHGIYGTALDQLKFSIEVSAPGYAVATAQVTKAPGGAEVVGQ